MDNNIVILDQENKSYLFTDYITNEEFEDFCMKHPDGKFVITVTKDLVDNKDYKNIHSYLRAIDECDISTNYEFYISFAGYDNDKRELYEIPEVREYLHNIAFYKPNATARLCLDTIRLIIISEGMVVIRTKSEDKTKVAMGKDKVLFFLRKMLDSITNPDDTHRFHDKFTQVIHGGTL